MIVVEAQLDDSERASISNTLISGHLSYSKIPRHLVKLVYASLLVSLLSFIFVLVDNVSIAPIEAVATILAFVLTLPHHGAVVLSVWLHRHQTESIFPFTPCSFRAIGYTAILVISWVASTIMCAIRLHVTTRSRLQCISTYNGPLIPPNYSCTTFIKPSMSEYWPSFASTVTSATELILITTITLHCYFHRGRPKAVPVTIPPSIPVAPQAKVISA
ncbi:hypothetical protein CVT25_007542 [Psilocybe cyanescens]|uniref:MARVEL domain-containing protein n=1 Tax=Psilocybe cyanescens TaxID=93625 RepID=A0A409X1U3_PSICY|nr:hypothetical protein CVT25_007542 [Psilocybe cyanescens]